jgi:putative two-component system response regulator
LKAPDTNKQPLVLVVDDDESMRALLTKQMELDGYRVVTAKHGAKALAECATTLPDVVLLDALMPGMDGFQVTDMLRASDRTQAIPIIMVTVLDDHPSRLRALQAGVQEFISKPIDRAELSLRVRNVLMLRDYGKLLAEQNQILERRVEERSRQVVESYRETITTLCRAAGYKDQETGSHIRRISYYTEDISHSLGMKPEFCETIRYASPMHDVGKIGIPDEILRKPGALSEGEWRIMQTHTSLGAELIGSGDSPYLRMGAEIALNHHERWDGSGYPAGLKGKDIPIAARIMNVCDQYDALRSARPYKQPLSHRAAFEIITVGNDRTRPAHFDPDVLEAFKRTATRFREIFETIKD